MITKSKITLDYNHPNATLSFFCPKRIRYVIVTMTLFSKVSLTTMGRPSHKISYPIKSIKKGIFVAFLHRGTVPSELEKGGRSDQA
jgi:hypothetical protein